VIFNLKTAGAADFLGPIVLETPVDDTPRDPEQPFNPINETYFERSDPDAAATFGDRVKNRWDEYKKQMHFNSTNPFAPWKSLEEFQLVEWLVLSKISQGSIDLFLQLPIVSALRPRACNAKLICRQISSLSLSFKNAKRLIEIIEKQLPQGPCWKSTLVTLADAPTEPQEFYHRDIIDCVKFLFQDPGFAEDMLYKATALYEPGEDQDEAPDTCEGLNRLYGEMNTGDLWVEEEARHLNIN
jgi:hypothetical protein